MHRYHAPAAPKPPSAREIAASHAADLAQRFQPGDYVLLARAGSFLHLYKVSTGKGANLAKQRDDLTRPIAAALGLPLTPYGLRAEREMDLIMKMCGEPLDLPVDRLGFAELDRTGIDYTLPDERGSPYAYRIWNDGRVEVKKREKD